MGNKEKGRVAFIPCNSAEFCLSHWEAPYLMQDMKHRLTVAEEHL